MTVAELAQFTTPGGHVCGFGLRPDTNDYNVVASIMAPHDEYSLPRQLSGVAVDAGAHIGGATIALALDNPDLRVVAIEPVPDNVVMLRENVTRAGVAERVDILHGAIGGLFDDSVTVWYGYRGTESLEHHAWIGNSTLAYDYGGDVEHEESTFVPLTLSHLIDRYGPITFLKIDTEGAEWAFLDTPLVKDVAEIVGEWHPVRGHTRADILALLESTHDVAVNGPHEGPGGFRAVRR